MYGCGMAIGKTVEETLVVDGARDEWVSKAEAAMRSQGFTSVRSTPAMGQVSGNYKKATVWGSLEVTLTPEGERRTRIAMSATGNVDNVFAIFSSPGRKILDRFKQGLR